MSAGVLETEPVIKADRAISPAARQGQASRRRAGT